MTQPCEKLDLFVDGELTPAEAEAFREHLATCAECARGLHDRMMLEAMIEPHREALREKTNVRSLDARRRRMPVLAMVAVLVPLAAAAAWMIRAGQQQQKGDTNGPVAMNAPLEVASTRSLEARVSYGAADHYRAYDVARAAGTRAREDVPLSTLAELEKKGDLHGVAAGLLLAGEDDRALQYLDRATASIDVKADRAALLLSQRRAADALVVLDGVLAENPKHPQALFNRALALRDLGLPLAAAEAFDKVAALGEPGWSDEARARATALREEHDARRDAWDAAKKAGLAMVAGGPPPPDAMVRSNPEQARHYLYHAVRAAGSRERVLSLAPLAATLDAMASGHVLADLVAQSALRDFAKRAPLAETYARLVVSADALDAKGSRAYLAALRAAGEKDMLFGAIALVDGVDVDATEYAGLAKTSGDPWMMAMAARVVAQSKVAHDDYAGAEETLRTADASCSRAHVEWRCTGVEYELSGLLAREGRTSDARVVAIAGLARARASVFEMESRMVDRLADAARMEMESSVSLVRAYLREVELDSPDDCGMQRLAHEQLAGTDMVALEPDRALRDLAARPRCDLPMTLLAADVLADAVRMGLIPTEPDAVPALEAFQATLPSGDRALGLAIEARLDPPNEAALLRRALDLAATLPDGDTSARKAEAAVYRTLADDAARAGRADDALDAIASGSRAGAQAGRATCTLGVAVEIADLIAVTRDAHGAAVVELGKRSALALQPSAIVSPAARARLEGCASVRVLALPPLHGTPELLPPNVAWRYASSGADVASRSAATERRVLVSDPKPPSSLGLSRLADWSVAAGAANTTDLRGEQATPSRVLAEISDATEVEINAHGFVDALQSSAAILALSPEASGHYALSATDIRSAHLRAKPIVVLGACHAAKSALVYHEAWSLPTAFTHAGARAVFASSAEIRDAEAAPFFDAVLARIRAGASPSVALRDERVTWLARYSKSWVKDVIDFE